MFWILQTLGWFILALSYFLLYPNIYLASTNAFIGEVLTNITGFLATVLLRFFYKRLEYKKLTIIYISLFTLIGTFITANLWLGLDILITQSIIGEVNIITNFSFVRFFGKIWSNSFVIFLWSVLYFGIKLWDELRKEKERAEKADALANKAQLQMLRYQLNPHFLFNSLNSIKSLIEEDKKKARSMVNELSDFLRYTLINENFTTVPLQKELDVIEHYFAIEKTRYEEKLNIIMHIDEKTKNLDIPNFLLHPIVENAIKYGMKTSEYPLEIVVSTKHNVTDFSIEVYNSGHWYQKQDLENGTGTGLNNVRQRLETLYPNKHKFNIQKNNNYVKVIIKIIF